MGAGGPSTEEGAPQPSLDAEVALNAPGFCPSSLVGCCLGKRFELLRHLAGVSGAYGYPYEAREVSTGQSVFVKVLRVPSQNSGYSVSRELEAVRARAPRAHSAPAARAGPWPPTRAPGPGGAAGARPTAPGVLARSFPRRRDLIP